MSHDLQPDNQRETLPAVALQRLVIWLKTYGMFIVFGANFVSSFYTPIPRICAALGWLAAASFYGALWIKKQKLEAR